jgi:hypothetical protein
VIRLSNLWRMPWNTLAGAASGAALMMWIIFYSPTWIAPLADAWEASHPVVTPISAAVVGRDDDSVVVRIVARKHLGDECMFLRVYASAVGADGLPALATVRRPDGSEHAGVTHEAGVRDFGVWRVRPVLPGARGVTVYTEHSCLGRVRKSTIAEVKL